MLPSSCFLKTLYIKTYIPELLNKYSTFMIISQIISLIVSQYINIYDNYLSTFFIIIGLTISLIFVFGEILFSYTIFYQFNSAIIVSSIWLFKLFNNLERNVSYTLFPNHAYSWITHLGALLWITMWWYTLRIRDDTVRTNSIFTMEVYEYQKPELKVKERVSFFRALLLIFIAFLVNNLCTDGTIVSIFVVVFIHIICSISFGPFVYLNRDFLRLIPTGVLLLIYLLNDIVLVLDSWGTIQISSRLGISVEGYIDARFSLAIGAVFTVIAAIFSFSQVYYAHVDKMKIDENPAPILMLFLIGGVISLMIIISWLIQL